MKKIFHFIIILFGIGFLVGCSANNAAQGAQDVPDAKPDTDSEYRIVSTTVAATEIFAALDLDLVGVPTTVKTLPERYEGLPDVGNPMSPDMEIIKSLQPTHVISVTTLKTDLEPVFENAGIDAIFLNLQSIDNMLAEIERLGEMFDREEEANELIASFEFELVEIEKNIPDGEAPKVLLLLGIPGSYLVATEHSYIGDLVKRAGGVNVIQGEDREYLASNTEYLYQANPDVILRLAHGMPDEVVKMFEEEFRTNDIWQHFNAVKNDRVYDLPEALFGTTASLRVTEALEELIDILYES